MTENEENFREELESVANFLRGGGMFDRRLPEDTRNAMLERAARIDAMLAERSKP